MRNAARLGLAIASLPLLAGCDRRAPKTQAVPVPRIGYLSDGWREPVLQGRTYEAFRAGLAERGWVEGQTIVIEHRFAEGQPDRLPFLTRELLGLQVNLIVAEGIAPTSKAYTAPGEVHDLDEIETAFAAAARAGVRGMPPNGRFAIPSNLSRVAGLAIASRLPLLTLASNLSWEAHTQDGVLLAYGINWPPVYRRTADFVDKILRGAKPGELPIEQPATFTVTINLRAARALGLRIPPAALAQATEVSQ